MSDIPQTPAQFEQLELAKVEGWYKELSSRTQAFAAKMQTAPTPPLAAAPQVLASYCFQFAAERREQIVSFLKELQKFQKTFLAFEPGAQYLSHAGLPQLAGRLSEILKDIDGAAQNVFEMHASAIEHVQAMTGISVQAQEETFKIIRETIANIRQLHDDAMKRWRDLISTLESRIFHKKGNVKPKPNGRSAPVRTDLTSTLYRTN